MSILLGIFGDAVLYLWKCHIFAYVQLKEFIDGFQQRWIREFAGG